MSTFIHVVTVAFMEPAQLSSQLLLLRWFSWRWLFILYYVSSGQINILQWSVQWHVSFKHWESLLLSLDIPSLVAVSITTSPVLILLILDINLNFSQIISGLLYCHIALYPFRFQFYNVLFSRPFCFFLSHKLSGFIIESVQRCWGFSG